MKRHQFTILFLVLTVAAAAAPSAAITVKLASLAPDGSVWDLAIEEMGAEWSDATDGRVRLRVYPGGVAGDEPGLGHRRLTPAARNGDARSERNHLFSAV